MVELDTPLPERALLALLDREQRQIAWLVRCAESDFRDLGIELPGELTVEVAERRVEFEVDGIRLRWRNIVVNGEHENVTETYHTAGWHKIESLADLGHFIRLQERMAQRALPPPQNFGLAGQQPESD